jgi:hypothetical protein
MKWGQARANIGITGLCGLCLLFLVLSPVDRRPSSAREFVLKELRPRSVRKDRHANNRSANGEAERDCLWALADILTRRTAGFDLSTVIDLTPRGRKVLRGRGTPAALGCC